MWLVILGTAAGCYLVKLAGLSVPARVLEHPGLGRQLGEAGRVLARESYSWAVHAQRTHAVYAELWRRGEPR